MMQRLAKNNNYYQYQPYSFGHSFIKEFDKHRGCRFDTTGVIDKMYWQWIRSYGWWDDLTSYLQYATELNVTSIQKMIIDYWINSKVNDVIIALDLDKLEHEYNNLKDDIRTILCRVIPDIVRSNKSIIHRAIPKIQQEFEPKSDINDVSNKFTTWLNNNLSSILTQVPFQAKSNGLYSFSWENRDKNKRNDADIVINHIKSSKDIISKFLSSINMNEDSFQQAYNMSFVDFINTIYKFNYSEDFQRKVRTYVMELNKNVIQDKAKMLDELDDKVGSEVSVDFDVTRDEQRERPIIVIKYYINKKRTKDQVLIGDFGEDHTTLQNKPQNKKYVNNVVLNEENKPTVTYAYMVGKNAFLDPKRMLTSFKSINEVRDILKNDPRINKVYRLLADPHDLKRLAKKLDL